MFIITKLTELTEFLDKMRNDIDMEVTMSDSEEIEYISIYWHDEIEHIHIKRIGEYEHLSTFDVEININHSEEFKYTGLNMKNLLFLLKLTKLIS